MILIFISIAAGVAGLTAGLGRGSIIGWGFGVLGGAGFLVLLVSSICSQMGSRPSFDSFSFGIFFFFVVLGITVGLFEGTLHHSQSLAGWAGLAGFVAGYGAGIFAGLWIQSIGWIMVLFNVLAIPAIIGLLVLDCVLLSSLFF